MSSVVVSATTLLFFGSARNEVRADTCVQTECLWIDFDTVAIEPDRLILISLGQVSD